jgi:hypothetical protein
MSKEAPMIHLETAGPLRRLVGPNRAGDWTDGTPELQLGDSRFTYVAGEVLECTVLTKCRKCGRGWGPLATCDRCAWVEYRSASTRTAGSPPSNGAALSATG